jgi:hypothetical protein
MSEKQGVSEDAYDAALQGPRDKAKARYLNPNPQRCNRYTHRHSVYWRCGQERPVQLSRAAASAWQAIASDAIQGDE